MHFFFAEYENCVFFLQNRIKDIFFCGRGIHRLKSTVREALRSPHPQPGSPTPGPRCFWIESSYPTVYRVSLVSVSELDLQKFVSLNFLRISSIKSIIFQKLKIAKIEEKKMSLVSGHFEFLIGSNTHFGNF